MKVFLILLASFIGTSRSDRHPVVPNKIACHNVITAAESNAVIKSHEAFPEKPYEPGYQCRFVINFPFREPAEVEIPSSPQSGIRPWDYAVIVDGDVAEDLDFICDVEKYKELGDNGKEYLAVLAKHFNGGQKRSFKSLNSSTIVVDICMEKYSKNATERKGFEIKLHSIASANNAAPSASSNSSSVSTRSCGRPQNPPSNNPNRIVNGVFARDNSHPWTCAIIQKPTLHFCDCSVIKDQWIVTAGHCVENSGDQEIKNSVLIYVGVEDLTTAGENNKFSVIQVVRHPNYNDPVGSTANDIALMKLDRPMTFSNDLMPICVPDKSVFEHVDGVPYATNGNRVCWVSGWGRLYENQAASDGGKIGAGSDKLKQVALEVISMPDCRNYLSTYTITDKMFCAGYDKGYYDACQGDSGGPLVCDDGKGNWHLHGIVSWGVGCAAEKSPGTYTNVGLFKSWIESFTGPL